MELKEKSSLNIDNKKIILYDSMIGDIVKIDNIFIPRQKDLSAELLSCMSICIHKNAKKALIVNSYNINLASNMIKYGDINVTLCIPNQNIYAKIKDFLPKIKSDKFIETDKNISTQKTKDKFDIIINANQGPISTINNILNLLNKDGIYISPIGSLMNFNTRQYIDSIKDHFSIFMPFCSPFNYIYSEYIFGSKTYHPTSDFQLQRADMLDGLEYYNATLHNSIFSTPKYIYEQYKGIFKN